MSNAIWWIRRDLRLADNQALSRAMELADHVLPVFVLDPHLLNSSYAGAGRIAFLLDGLRSLDADLRARGSRLILREGEPGQVLGQLCHEYDVATIVAEKDVSPYATQRDNRVEQLLDSVAVEFVEGLTIRPIGYVRKADGLPYTVFTPYSRRWKADAELTPVSLLPAPAHITTPHETEPEPKPYVNIAEANGGLGSGKAWRAGEAAAYAALDAFTDGASPLIYDYSVNRDRPDLDATSSLSPYLRFGMISPRAAAIAAYEAVANAPSDVSACRGRDLAQ